MLNWFSHGVTPAVLKHRQDLVSFMSMLCKGENLKLTMPSPWRNGNPRAWAWAHVTPHRYAHAFSTVDNLYRLWMDHYVLTSRQKSVSVMPGTRPAASVQVSLSPYTPKPYLEFLHRAADLAYAQRSALTTNHNPGCIV